MKTGPILLMLFRELEQASEMSHRIGKDPFRLYVNKNGLYVIHYDLFDVIGIKKARIIHSYTREICNENVELVIDVPIFFKQRFASRTVKIDKKILLFATNIGAKLEISVYRTE